MLQKAAYMKKTWNNDMLIVMFFKTLNQGKRGE
jgi:hypothetical protein